MKTDTNGNLKLDLEGDKSVMRLEGFGLILAGCSDFAYLHVQTNQGTSLIESRGRGPSVPDESPGF